MANMCSILAPAVDRRQGGCQDAGVARLSLIADPGDSRLLPYVGLTDAAHRRRHDTVTATFVVEGVTAIRQALRSSYPVLSVLVTPAKAEVLAADLAVVDLDVYVAERAVMGAVAGFDIHRGAVAVAGRTALPSVTDLLGAARTVAVLEGINDHENLGAIARSAVALGVDGLLLDPTCADPLYRRSVRVSMGEILHLPFARAVRWPDDLHAVRQAGFAIVALTPGTDARTLDEVAAELAGTRVALVLGAEGPGLASSTLTAADWRARIPLRPGSDSLNVGHAAAVAFYEIGRHRRR
jgi:tRNA G18 (ribose-2'-O)-methylase SpoU